MIDALIHHARRRYVANQFLAQGAYALSAGMAGLILLLIAGTQVLDWPFLVVIIGGTLALGAFRILRHVPTPYRIAQLVDRRLFLADTLSTAVFFAVGGENITASMRDGQRSQAEQVAARADVDRAMPFSMPRAVYSLAALGLVASGLFALRYGMSRTLDLRAPLARIVRENFGESPREAVLRQKARTPRPDGPKPIGLSLPEGEANTPQQLDPAADSALDTVGVPDAVNDPLSQNQNNSKAKTESASMQKTDGAQGDAESSEGADSASGESASDSQQGAKNGKQTGAAGNQGSSSQSNSDQNASLVSKLRDAMSNLLSKMRQQGGGSQQQSGAGQKSQKGSAP